MLSAKHCRLNSVSSRLGQLMCHCALQGTPVQSHAIFLDIPRILWFFWLEKNFLIIAEHSAFIEEGQASLESL